MLFKRRYGRIGWLALPYLWLFELIAPVIELGGIVTIISRCLYGCAEPRVLPAVFDLRIRIATIISIGSVLQEEITYKRYNDWQDVVRLVSYCFLEHFPYRQMHMVWRLQGLVQYLRGDNTWKPLKRKGLESRESGKHIARAATARIGMSRRLCRGSHPPRSQYGQSIA